MAMDIMFSIGKVHGNKWGKLMGSIDIKTKKRNYKYGVSPPAFPNFLNFSQ